MGSACLIVVLLLSAVSTHSEPQNLQQNPNLDNAQNGLPHAHQQQQQPPALPPGDLNNKGNFLFQPQKLGFYVNPNSPHNAPVNLPVKPVPVAEFKLGGQTYKRTGNEVVQVDANQQGSKTNNQNLPNFIPDVKADVKHGNDLPQRQQNNENPQYKREVKENIKPQVMVREGHKENNSVHVPAINMDVGDNGAPPANKENRRVKVIQYNPNAVDNKEVFNIQKNKFEDKTEKHEPKADVHDLANDVFDKKTVGDNRNAGMKPDLLDNSIKTNKRTKNGEVHEAYKEKGMTQESVGGRRSDMDIEPDELGNNINPQAAGDDRPQHLGFNPKEGQDPPPIRPAPSNNMYNIPFGNEVPKMPVMNHMPKIQVPQRETFSDPEDSDGSMKVVWDWSDFAVNFEQYVMPEQKIRRAPHASTGEPWPLPHYYVSKEDKVYEIDPKHFHFKVSRVRCDILDRALERYRTYILEDAVEDMYDNFQHAPSTMIDDPALKYETPLYLEAPTLAIASVKVRRPCAKYPAEKSDETYDLFVKRTGIYIWANEVWGALRGLETLSQLVYKGSNQQLYIRDTVINDYPRFSHRGVMIDSSRHFIFKETIFDVLEGMAQNKMNVLHWHLVDDQSFPYQSRAYPDLSEKGAFHPTFVYTPEDVADIIEFARLRGIRVIPEFDIPGHSYSWGLSRPDLLTQCYQGDKPVDGYLGPMDPSKNETFRFLKTFMKEALHSFRDRYIHLGGDEVPMTCWSSNPEVMKFLSQLEGRADGDVKRDSMYYYSYDVRKVLEYFVSRLISDVKAIGNKRNNGVRMVFWQEIMNNNVQLPNDTIIQIWQGGMEDVQRATSEGLNVIYSTCWYLDLIEYGTKWSKYYQCDPVDSTFGYSIDESKVLGGEACLWAEYIDNENLMTTLWPRASAAAERLWSSKDVKDLDAAAPRLQEHRCRMLSRGLGVGQISGPDYCLRRGKRHHSLNDTVANNCTQAQCAIYSEKSRVEVEKFKVEFQQKGGHMSDCSQAVIQAGGHLALILLLLIIIAVFVTLKFNKWRIVQLRLFKNKSILLVFIILVLIYFMCYTTIWLQAMQFKGSFEKSISSNVQDHM